MFAHALALVVLCLGASVAKHTGTNDRILAIKSASEKAMEATTSVLNAKMKEYISNDSANDRE